MNEFELINQYFKPLGLTQDPDKKMLQGIGDDCALIECDDNKCWAISTDTLVAGVHFFNDDAPMYIAQRAMGVSFSDLAAMGAKPYFFSLALTLPDNNTQWVSDFSQGIATFCEEFPCQLIGGDTTRGPLTITLSVMGLVDKSHVLRRGSAQEGDSIYVSGELGSAAAAIYRKENECAVCEADVEQVLKKSFYQPKPRFDLIDSIKHYSSTAIDISDGLVADLQHICEASGVDAHIQQELVPINKRIMTLLGEDRLNTLALCGGDDYQLCFTVPKKMVESFEFEKQKRSLDVACIGEIKRAADSTLPAVTVLRNGKMQKIDFNGYQHFD